MKQALLQIVWLTLILGSRGHGQEAEGVIAHVGKQAITLAEIDFHLGRRSNEKLADLSHATLQNAIRLIALQRQALQTMRTMGVAANGEEVERSIVDSDTQSADEQSAQVLVERTAKRFGIETHAVNELVAFRLSWRRYLAAHLSTKNVSKHFRNQKARFDGTRYKVRMITATVDAGQSAEREKAGDAMASLVQRIESGQVAFAGTAEEVSKYDWSMTDEYWVRGTGQLDPSVIDAVMELSVPAVSSPVHTASGVHIVQLIEKEPGSLELAQAKDEVRAHMLIFLLEHLAARSSEKLPLVAAGP